ncbi:hypothetical protein D9619_012511 [Psilocybe cf. subviscida]|uniref:BTB domain-containing protein n=1 Tax=Psilocybe cf. subviscida TaxID=2480587 RepID=A0A8H5EZ55_9AGAR|nr:hypothetical protein D9619_012511 [Psilocybe cf. subviscida]
MSASPPSSSGPSTSRSQEFWFDDGSIILQVEMTQFRVHRAIICANSVVFRDMHELSEPGDRETANGCPVVVLHGDIAVDWNNLLWYMYFPARASKRAEHLAFPLVVSLLRLGKKYQFSDIWALALHTVRVQVPVNELESWDFVLDDDIPFHSDDTHIPGYWLADHEIDLLNIAVEHDIKTILPIAYYLCTHRYSLVRVLVEKHRILSGTGSKVDGALSTVHPDALKTLLVGRQKLQSAYSITRSP